MKLGSRLQFVALVPVIVFTSACTVDVTKSETLHDYIDQCFVSIQEAILLSRECKNVWTYCDTVAPISNRGAYPATLQEYGSDPTGWSASIHEFEKNKQPPLAPDHIVVYGGLQRGSSFKVTRILSQFDGENGRYWDVYATVQNGEFKGRNVLLPRPAMGSFNFDYLKRCEREEPKASH
jgi:hypothetical protein